MKLKNQIFIIILFLTSCGQKVEEGISMNTSIKNLTAKYDEEENEQPDTKDLRKEYISNYNKIELIDTFFKNSEGKLIHIQTKYYCLFDSAIVVPKKYVWEDTTRSFTTHNYSQDIKIIVDKDTIFNNTIKKDDFADKLYPELKKHAVLMFPNFSYDKENNLFEFGFSITIPITDVGEGWRLIIDNNGNISKTDK
jgi:hypothetical protein